MKGQVTVYIILGLVVTLIAGIALYSQQRITAPSAFQPVNSLVQGCLETSIYHASLRAHTLAASNFLRTGFGEIGYGVLGNKNVLPGIGEYEAGIAQFIAGDVQACAKFTAIPGFAVEAGNLSASVIVSKKRITASIKWPLRIKKAETSIDLKEWSSETESDFGLLHSLASEIAAQIALNPDNVDLSSLSAMAAESAVIPYDTENFVIALKSRKLLRGSEQLFAFAVKPAHNKPPALSVPGILHLKDGQRTTIQASAADPEGSAVYFEDDTSLFDIDKDTGIAFFTPEVRGRYDVRIRAYDEKGLFDEESMVVIVE